ncbi:hypothetical protein RYX36_027876 [Vicia faba]
MATAPSSSVVTADTNTTQPPSSSVVPEASPSPVSAIDFFSLCHQLKTRKRTRWLRSGIKNPESMADHMYRMSLMALIAPDVPGLDRNKCIKMAMIHDIAEAMILDTTPLDEISKEIKHQRGQAAVDYICRILGVEGSRGKEVTELWMDYEANSSPEAKFVKDLDKVEMILQALDYEEDEQGKDLDEFFRSTAGKFQTEIGKAWASEIVSRRNNTQLGS